ADVIKRRSRGDDVVVMSERLRPVRLWSETVEGRNRVALTPATRTAHSFVWAPDGARLAVQMTETPDIDADYMFRRIYTVPAAGGEPVLLTETEGKLGTMAWSPDGRRLAFVGAVSFDDPLAQSAFIAEPGARAVNRTPDFEGSVLTLAWLDAQTIVFVAAEGTHTVLARLNADRGAPERIAGAGAEVFTSFSMAAGSGRFAVPASTAAHPAEVFAGSVRDGTLQRLTTHNAWLADVRLARQETIEWTGADGLRIEGVYIHPLEGASGGPAPLAVLPHGGPEGISYDGWTTSPLYPAQVLAAHGYAVLMPNYRGSGGRGVAFAKADHRDLGGREFDDVLLGIDDLAARDWVDADRVGISGTSYGGYFSALAGTRYSDRFRLAMPFAGITNWISFTGTTDIPVEMSEVHWDLWWFDNPGLAMDRSPIAYIADARTPMVIGHGMADERVHPEQSLELWRALELQGVPVELVLYPREPHGLRERAHQLDYMGRILSAFDRYVKPPKTTTD
ncbi:MAG: S9 family peptidase, partial [Gemmatimonadota bacterium]